MPTKQDVPTPALLLDLDAFEANLALMAGEAARRGKKLRPHAKAHKCVEIARRQIASGACGLCVATVPEAELLSNAGIPGLLLTSPLADPLKIARVIATGAMAVVDHPQQTVWFEEAARAANRSVDLLIDLDVGDHRTGATETQALSLAEEIGRSPHLRLRGLQGYSVSASHAGGPDREERRHVSAAAFERAVKIKRALADRGLPVEILSGGSTGTWDIDTLLPEVTEIQAGSYALMDLAYGKLGLPFRHSLTVLATVVSANYSGFVTVDAGFKAFATDRGYGPDAVNRVGSAYRWGGDEFGYLDGGSPPLRLGEKIEFVPPHCDPTVNLYDRIHACRGDRVEAVWPIMDRLRA